MTWFINKLVKKKFSIIYPLIAHSEVRRTVWDMPKSCTPKKKKA